MKKDLYKKKESIDFYEDRYEKGYMDEWPIEKKQRVFDVIKKLPLPETGTALDFGCGNGVFTDVMRQALPHWKIYGCDISLIAVNNAKIRFPFCNFFVSDNEQPSGLKFDFLFSHHVLEHVFDIKTTINQLNTFLKPESNLMLIFPCGNENSFEYKVCKMRIDGINKKMENRFFFEDEGHIRRLNTEQTNELLSEYDFILEKDLYSNQYFGSIKWISQSSPGFILKFADPEKSIDKKAQSILSALRIRLILLHILQLPAIYFNHLKGIRRKKIKDYIILFLDIIPYLISSPFYFIVNSNAMREWENNKHLKNGSEMYLFYSRK